MDASRRSRAPLFIVAICIALGSLAVYFWPVDRAPSNEPSTRREHEEPSAPAAAGVREPFIPEGVASQGPSSEEESPQQQGDLPQKALGEPTFLGIIQLETDPGLAALWSNPEVADTKALQDLVARARKVMGESMSEEAESRVNAGLYERMPEYRLGEPLKVSGIREDVLESVFFTENGEALRISFPPSEYPRLYSFQENLRGLERELRKRDLPK